MGTTANNYLTTTKSWSQMPYCWKSHALAHLSLTVVHILNNNCLWCYGYKNGKNTIKHVLWLVTRTRLTFIMDDVHISHNNGINSIYTVNIGVLFLSTK